MRVPRELLKAELILPRFARFAKADLVRRNHAITGGCKRGDCGLPGCRAEVLAMQQDSSPAVGPRRFHIHIGHLQRLPLRLKLESRYRPRIVKAFQFRPVSGLGLRSSMAT